MKMEKKTNAGKEQGDTSAKRLNCSVETEAFCCDVCSKPLRPPIFQCPEGHLCCSSCNDELAAGEKKCTHGSGCTGGTLARNLGMERAVRSILVDCVCGCTKKIAYYETHEHEELCPPHAPWRCPGPGCGGFAGRSAAELLEHLTDHHKWPSMAFRYWEPFDLRVVGPGTHVLRCEGDGQLFLLSVQAAEPAGLAVSLVSVQYLLTDPNAIGCSVSFSTSRRHRSTSTLDGVRPWWHFSWPPTEYICFVAKVSDGENDGDDAAVVLTINITAVDENDGDSDDSSFDYEYYDEKEDYDDEDEDEDDSS